MASSSPIAKVTRPVPVGFFPRKRLYRLLDRSRKSPLLWITGPPGCGKTTLVSSYIESRRLPCLWYKVDEGDADLATFFYYLGLAAKKAAPRSKKRLPLLTPDRLPGLTVFAHRYFELLSAMLPVPCLLVLDDCHHMQETPLFFETLREGVSRLSPGIVTALVSRSDPHPSFSRERANRLLKVFGWEDLRLTPEETAGIVRLRRKGKSPPGLVRDLFERTDGWAAGLVLLLEREIPPAVEPGPRFGRTPAEMFDYFGSELFDRASRPVREFLVKTAFLPDMTVATAEALTGQRRAAQLLSFLCGSNFFLSVHRHSELLYRYHPLFREFLLSRARDLLNKREIHALKRKAAVLLEEEGRIEDAAELFHAIRDRVSLTGLILAHAPSLLAQGRNRILETWLGYLPKNVVEGDPWLLYWLGKCRMPYDPAGSRRLVERSFEHFRQEGDPAGTFLSWSLIMDNLCMFLNDFKALDEWIDRFDEIVKRFPAFPSPEIEACSVVSLLGGLYMRRVDHPDIVKWVARASYVTQESSDLRIRLQGSLYLFLYHIWTGNFPKAQVMIESLRALASASDSHPEALILFHMFEAKLNCGVARFDRSLRSVEKGLEVACENGMRVWDFLLIGEGTAASLGKGDLDAASEYLDRMVPHLDGGNMNEGYFHYLSSWRSALVGDYPLALSFAERALELAHEMGAPCAVALTHLYLARLRLELGQVPNAERHYKEALRIAGGLWSAILTYQCRLVGADIAFASGEERRGLELLSEALAIGREKGYFHYENWLPPFMIRLCARALAEGLETEYVREVIRRRVLVPDSPPVEIDDWPWPVRIYTFGRFSLQRDGSPVTFARKVQKRPLLLLKALTAYGGRAVREEQLTDAVWPEAEGDLAIQAMAVALRRLRQLLGYEEAVRRREGMLELDPRFCWVDAFAFERLLEKAASQREKGRGEAAAELEEKALQLYRGPFLAEETGQSWTVSMRERLRNRYLATVGRLGADRMRAAQWDRAREHFQRGIESDALAEEFYQSLMRCYLADGRMAEALAVYGRLEKVLASMGVEPSPGTRSLLTSLRTT